ncbi:MAG: ABC transporter ATP-binding protein [bacterium]|nr:ABC transporter ATP-binding protein [bacterium]
MGDDYTVKAEGLCKEYRLPGETIYALTGVDLKVKLGEFVTVMGPSGAGKTTLLNILGLLDEPTAGSFDFGGFNGGGKITPEKLRRSFIGFVFEEFYLIPALKAKENVALPNTFGADEDDAARLLDLVGLSERASHYPRELSGGEMQRVAIARALYGKPRLILADEPTGNLDTRNAGRIFDLLGELSEREGVSVIAATHSPRLARKSHRILHLSSGEIVGEEVMGNG